MKIELIKLKFNDTHSYKYKPFTYCCDEIHQNDCIVFTNDYSSPLKYFDTEGNFIPQFCTSYTETFTSYEDDFERTENFHIKFCPHCGEKIEISVVEKIDVSDKYEELTKQRERLLNKCRITDSKREEAKLKEQVRDLNEQINDFYELSEWKG